MRKLIPLLSALLLVSAAWAQDASDPMRQDLFSNYGGWVNLTAGITADTSNLVPNKSELMVSGNTVHFLWAENEGEEAGPDNSYRVLYRRSTDGGTTWEDTRILTPRCVVQDAYMYEWNGYSNMMQVAGNTVHVLVPYNYDSHCSYEDEQGGKLIYFRSTDGGATFQSTPLDTTIQRKTKIFESIIRVDGQNVVIAAKRNEPNDYVIALYRSTDGGTTFRRDDLQQIGFGTEKVEHLGGLEMVNGKWAILSSGGNGGIYVFTGDMQTDEFATSQLVVDIDHTFYLPKLSQEPQDPISGGVYGDLNYHSLIAMPDENTIHVLFAGRSETYSHMYHMRSIDGGATWSPEQAIDETSATHAALVAKGQNVYAIVGGNTGYATERRWVVYSHDGGVTWGANQSMIYGTSADRFGWYEYDSPYSYDIVLDPNDPTGLHAWYIGAMGLDLETHDGFSTISRANRYDGFIRESMGEGRLNNFNPVLAVDGNGIRHMVMRVMGKDAPGTFATFYRKETPEPAPNGTNMAFHNTRAADMNPDQRIVLPMTQELYLDSAMTVGFWVRIDSLLSNTSLISLRINQPGDNDDSQIQNYWQHPGWSIGFESNASVYEDEEFKGLRAYPVAFISTDRAIDGGTTLGGGAPYDDERYMLRHPGLWHYVALTWDGHQYEDNAHLYMDGLLLGSATVNGAFAHGTNPIVIGDWFVNNIYSSDWYMDELQIWNRALTEDEVLELSNHRPVLSEGCIVNLGFDGTLKDLSGHGNDAVAQLNCNLVEYEGLRLPAPAMHISPQSINTLSFSDQTMNGEAVYWYFDDPELPVGYGNSGSIMRYPKHTYDNAGTIYPVLISRGENACAPAKKMYYISGRLDLQPSVVGQSAGVTLCVRRLPVVGTGIEYTFMLRKEGQPDIYGRIDDGSMPTIIKSGLRARFDLSQAEIGQWDVVIGVQHYGGSGSSYTIEKGLTIEPLDYPDVWATISGSSRFLVNRSKDYTIEYGNSSNGNAYNVPFYLYIQDYVDVDLLFDVDRYSEGTEPEVAEALDEMGDYVVFDAGEYGQMRCYPFLIPYIAGNSRAQKRFLINSGSDVHIFWAMDKPWGPMDYDENGEPIIAQDDSVPASAVRHMPMAYGRKGFSNDQIECMMNFLGWGTMDAVMGSIPFLGCAYGIGKTAFMGATDKPKDRWGNLFTNTISTAFSCAMDFNPLGWGWRACTLAGLAFNTAMNIYSAKGCGGGEGDDRDLYGVGSYDPNEMIGPKGYGEEHYMKPKPEMGYTITFENKSSATAPAHEVFVNDTLSAASFDLSSFGFTSYGWADTTIYIEEPTVKDFVHEVDMRPARNIIVRVSGSFNDSTGVAKWSFVSLDPATMDYAEEVDDGFLIPNNDQHEGEGFVSFGINHLADLASGAQIANKATIIFDANAPIETNNYINTLDIDLPASRATAVTLVGDSLLIEWTAGDATSGVAAVDLYVSKNDSAFKLVQPLLRGTSYKMAYSADTTYCFATIARDHVGWRENKAESELSCEAQLNTEGIENHADGLPSKESRKVIIDGQLYIILPDGTTYNAQGVEVK